MAAITSFRDLDVWRRSMALAKSAYEATREFPKSEEYRISSQIVRASISIPANIAEGFARSTRKDYRHFVGIARGSSAELETLLLLSIDLGFGSDPQMRSILEDNENVSRMLNKLHQRLAPKT